MPDRPNPNTIRRENDLATIDYFLFWVSLIVGIPLVFWIMH